MGGFVQTRDLFRHGPLILASFGPRAYFRCLQAAFFSRRPVTFLQVILGGRSAHPSK
jgi:hypothetical protein